MPPHMWPQFFAGPGFRNGPRVRRGNVWAAVLALLAEPSIRSRDLSSLRLLSYGAAPMSPSRIREAWAAFGPVLAQGYGAKRAQE